MIAKTGTSYTYDSDGNTITKTDSTGTPNCTWDYENRLSNVTLPGGGGTVTFTYGPFGRRVYKMLQLSDKYLRLRRCNLVEETSATGAVVARCVHNLEIYEPLAMLRSGSTSYYHGDGRGYLTLLSNTAGSLAQTYAFDSCRRRKR